MLSIDEAIAFERQQAKDKRNEHYTFGIQKSKEAAEEHEQLAEWLEELKAIKDGSIPIIHGKAELELHDKEIYNKAIDDFVKEICKMIVQSESNGNYRFYAVDIKQAIADLAEQLKAGDIE